MINWMLESDDAAFPVDDWEKSDCSGEQGFGAVPMRLGDGERFASLPSERFRLSISWACLIIIYAPSMTSATLSSALAALSSTATACSPTPLALTSMARVAL